MKNMDAQKKRSRFLVPVDRLSRLKVENQGRAVGKRRNTRATPCHELEANISWGSYLLQDLNFENCHVLDFVRDRGG